VSLNHLEKDSLEQFRQPEALIMAAVGDAHRATTNWASFGLPEAGFHLSPSREVDRIAVAATEASGVIPRRW
jgi:hypothetical protein